MIYLGMDVHKYAITIAVLPEASKSPTRLERRLNDLAKLRKWISQVARDGEGNACYLGLMSREDTSGDRQRLVPRP